MAPVTPARAFTLIETVLAVTLIASVTALAAMVWSSAVSHVEAADDTAAAADAQRIVELATAQWQSRRTIKAIEERGGQDAGLIAFAHDGVSFVTTRAVVFTDWPLVHVTYRVVQNDDGTASLVYLETRVMNTTGDDPLVGGLGADGRARTAGIELIANSDSLTVERYGIAPLFLDDPDWVRRAPLDFVNDGASQSTNRSTADTIIRLNNDETVSIDMASQRALYGDPTVPELVTPRWRTFLATDPLEGPPPAVRITGTLKGEPFTCVFANRDSR